MLSEEVKQFGEVCDSLLERKRRIEQLDKLDLILWQISHATLAHIRTHQLVAQVRLLHKPLKLLASISLGRSRQQRFVVGEFGLPDLFKGFC